MSASSTRPPAAAAAACETVSVHDECCCEWFIALAGGWGCMLMCLLAVQKSVSLLGEAKSIDSLWSSLPSLYRGTDSAMVVLYLPSRNLSPSYRGASVAPFVLCVCAALFLFFFCYSFSPITAESAQGGLLHLRSTPTVVVAERSKTHAQMCNSFLCLVTVLNGAVAFRHARTKSWCFVARLKKKKMSKRSL